MADQRVQSTEELVGANHATKSDTVNRITVVEHANDGTHAIPKTGINLLDTDDSNFLKVKCGSDLTADKTLSLITGDTDRSLTLGANSSIAGTALVESLLTTQGDMIVRGAAAAEKIIVGASGKILMSTGVGALPEWTDPFIGSGFVHTGTLTRNSGGDQEITGLGFKPKQIIFVSVDTNTASDNWSVGFDNVTYKLAMYVKNNGGNRGLTLDHSINIYRDVNNSIQGYVLSLDADGMTIRFSLDGICDVSYGWWAIG